MVTPTSTKDAPATSVSGDSKRALVRRVAESATFGKSERLSSFLSFICELTLNGRADEINEQKIGTSVFGRAPGYDSSIDGIVRPQASRLRQRLDLYFRDEGLGEPVRITLPRGSYVPVFEPHSTSTGIVDVSPEPLIDTIVSPSNEAALTSTNAVSGRQLAWILGSVLLVVLITSAVVAIRSTKVQSSTLRTPHPLWSLLFRSNERTVVVPSDTGLVLWQGSTKRQINLAAYLSGEYRATSSGDREIGQVDAADLASRRYTSIVDLDIVKQMTQIADSSNTKIDVRYARDLRPNDLKDGNIVLIGAPAANPWVELFEPSMNFVFSNAHIREYSVINRTPLEGEPSMWNSHYDDPQHHVYGVIAFLPNLSGEGNVLILEGTSMAGTECAWDFAADDSSLIPFLDRIKRADGSIPHFQLILDSTNLTGSSVKRNILAWRVMK